MVMLGCSFNQKWKAGAIKEKMCVYAKGGFRGNICTVENNDKIQKLFTNWQEK